jgi:large repetitive protein
MRKLLLLLFVILNVASADAQTITMSSGTVNGCSGTLLDPGGAANYPMNCNNTMTFCSNAGNCVQLSFTQFNIESGYDFLYVYNGPSTASPQMAGSPFTGTALPPTLTCTSGCITIRFTSDGIINAPGFSINISCVTCPPPPPAPIVASDCSAAANICSNASFSVDPNGFGAVNELPSGTTVNPSTNPVGPNSGCLLSGELNSTWMVINIASNGTLQFSIGSPSSGCLDWIMFAYNPATTCNAIATNSISPVTCNWNGACNGFTGMASPIPAGGNASNFQPPLNVTCGQQYLMCLSNYSSLTTTLPLNFFGTATVSCVVVSPTTVNNATICAGQSATLTANATGATSYSWSPSTGLTPTTGASVSASPAATTTYTVTSTGSCGSSTATATVTVNNAATLTVNSATICAGQSTTLTATPSTTGGTYSWSPGGATTSSITVSPGGTTTYTCTYTRLGCVGTATGTVTVNPVPVITAPPNIVVCAGAAIPLQSFTSTPAGAAIAWSNSNSAIGLPTSGSGSVPGFTATNATASPITSTITVTPTLGSCPGTPATYTITVNPLPTSTYNQSANQCLTGNSFSFTNTGSSGAGYTQSWNFGGAVTNTSTAVSPSGVTYASAGTYTVTHTVTATGGCTSTTTSTVTVYPAPTGLTASTGPATCGLNNGTITITSGVGGTSPYTYSVNGGAFSSTLNYTGQTPGSHTIIVQDANGCQFTTTVNVPTSPGPTALAVTTVNATCGLSNGVINIGATTGGTAGFTYSVNGSAFSSTTSYPGFASGTYTVIVKDANGCTFSTTATVSNTPGPTALAVTTVNSTCGLSNGVINIGATTGGTSPYTYNVNGAGFSSTTSYTGFAAGTYTVIVKDANGCTFSTTATITNNPGPTALANTHVNATCGASNGTITLGAVTGGSGPYTYSVNGSAFTTTTNYTGFAAGTYTLIVKDVNGCTFTTTVTITNASGPTALAVSSTNSTCGAANGTVTIGATTGGTSPYTYSFNGSAFTSTTSYTSLAAGTYSIVVKDASGCTFTTSVVVTNTAGPTALATTTINSNCGAANGTLNIGAVTGGTSPYTYSVNGSAFTTTTSYPSLAAGTYTIVVKDVNGCTFTTTATIVNNPGPTALAVTTVNSTCGASNGVVNIGAVTGGTAAYTYSLNGGAFTSTTSYTGLAAGTYTVVVKDANGCTFSTTATVVNSPGPTALASSTVNSTCGLSNGTVNIGAVTGGTAAYVFSFNGSPFTSTVSYTGQAAGTYTIIVKDANGCTFTTTATVANSPGPTALATTVTNAACGASNGSITIGTVTGGSAAYTYSVNGSAFTSTTSYTGFAAGTYSVVVKDANGCTFTTSATITNASGPTALATSSTNASCGSSTGTATLGAVTGGVAPYTYSFNGSAFTSSTSYTALASGTYTVIVKDANGCTFTTTVTVGSNAAPTALATTTTNSTCGASNGVITIGAVTGGIAPYTYSVNGSPFTTTTTYGSLAAGTYTVIVKDVNGCTFSTTATIINSPGPTALAVATVNSTCGATNGVINIGVVTGGSPAYTYSVNGSAFTTTTSYTGFGAGTYTVIVKDANGCTFSTTATVVNTPGPTALATSSVNSTCGASNGSITIGAVTGGTAAYVYSFNGSAFTATTTYTGLAAGTYTVVVKDANGCTFTVNPAVTNTPGPTALATTFTNPTCGNSNGTITVGATTGGTAAYMYSFNGGGFSSTTSYTGLTAGTYTIIVQDANGCQFTATRTITNVPGPTAQATSTTNASCGASNGSITIGSTTGGTPSYTYSVNGSAFTATTVYSGLAANTYPVVVQDANGCQFTTSATVANSSGPTALVVNTTNAACGASTGTITIGATTGGVAPYSYSVNGSAFTATTSYTGFAAGTYTVIVKDANGCTFSTSAIVNPTTGPTALAVTTANSTCGASNGTITIGAVTGGTAAYSYSVNGSAFTSTTSYTGFAAGTYTVIVKDANGCQFSTTATITNIPGPTAIATTVTNTTCGNANGAVALGAVTGGTPAYTYSFNGSAFTSTTTYSSLAAGTYSVVVKDNNGCTFTTSVTLTNTPGPTALATTFTNPTCGNSNGTITIGAATGGTPAYTYSFNGGGFTATTSYTGLAAGTYPIIVQDANGCQFTVSRTITNVPGPTALATTTTNSSCGAANGTATIGAVTGGTAPYTYSFNGGAFAPTTSFTGLATNSYPVIVQDANGCQFTTTAVVNNSSGPTALAVTNTNATCGASNGTATIGATTGGVLPLSYSFNGGAFSTTTSYTALAAGTYAVIVKDANGCTFTTSVTISNIAGPTAVAVTSVNTTCGAANGSITLGAVTGGTTPYTYSVNASAFTSTTSYTSLVAGTYNIVVKDANGCTFTTTATITDVPGPTAIATTVTNTTCGNANGAVALGAVTGGTPAYTYSFNGSAFTSSISYTGLAAGSYSIVVKDANGCTFTTAANIINTPGPTALATSTVNSTCGNANGTINIGLVTGGTSPYTFSFNGGGFTSTINYTGLAAGTYPVIVQDANGCQFTVNPAVSNTSGPTAQATSVINSTCGGANGTVNIGTTTGGTPPYTYSVNGSAFTATTSYTGLIANTYSVVVKDANGCTFTTSATIIDLSGLTASVTSQTNVSCNGGTNGSVTVTASGSTAPYSYALGAGAFGASGTFSSLTAGTYTVVAKDGNGCTFSVPVIITEPSVLTGTISSQTNVNCFNGTTGAVTVSASGGTTPSYTYSIDGGAFGSSATFTGLTAGSHPVVVKDGNGCTVTVPVTITQPTALTLATSSTNATCVAFNGSATVTASGATPLYTYLWAPGGQTTATASSIQAGNYSVLVTDFNGCTQTANVTVGMNPGGNATISSSTNVTCTGANNGSATVSMGAGSTPGFTYAWSPSSQTTVTATNLAPGSYTVTVTDGNGCVSSASTVITQPTVITNTLVTNNISCNGGSNGSITINPAGGTPGYNYFWTPGGYTTQTIAGLTAGTYSCVVTDMNGCTASSTVTLTQPTPIVISETHVDANCNQSNGSATANAAGGTGPYTYSWSTSPVTPTAAVTGLPANTYVVTVTDFKGCVQTLPVTIGNLAGPVASILSSTNVSCYGLTNGTATVTMTGGTPPFNFLWTNGQTVPSATNLAAGTYTLNATDGNGCSASTSVTITEPALLDASIVATNPTCNSACNGNFVSTAFGGTAPYSYLWSPGAATTSNVTGLCAGTYTLQVTDGNNCTSIESIALFDPPAVTATTTHTDVTCNGLCNGTATANPGAGTGPFTYLWSDINAQTTQTATGLCSGTYTVTVTDAGGCSTTASVTITTPNAMIASIITSGNVTCYAACDGYAQANVTGGSAPYNFMWMPSGTSGASVNNLCAATYTVTVTDANGCTATTNVNIIQPNPLVATITNTDVTCYNACDAQATAVYTGGTGPYTFIWTPSVQTTPTATALCAGVHNLAITDSMGCTANASVVIVEPTILAVTTTTTNSDCGNANGSACAAVVGGSPPFIYSWNDPATQATNCATGLNGGAYTISVTDSHGCSITNVANVNDNGAPVVTIPLSSNVTCAGAANGSAQGNITGGIMPYTIDWSPGTQTSLFASGLSGGIYSMVVTDSVGCVGSASVTINEPSTLVSAITASAPASCYLSCDGSATVLAGGGTTPYTYLWNDGALQSTATATGLCAQSYTTTITDANGCTSQSMVTISQPTQLVISLVSTTNVSCNGGNNGQITISVAGGTPGYTYTWTPSVGSGPIVTNLTAGTYSVLVTDANGCSKTAVFDIIEPNALVLVSNSNSSTCGNADGSAGVTVTGGTVPYAYSWTPTGASSAIITSVPAGVYSVVVTDANGCTASSSSTVTDIAAPTISSITFTPPLCNGTPTGTATVFAAGGTPIYTYQWTGPGAQTSQTATAFSAGVYSVTVSDANHCSVTGSVVLTQPDTLEIVVSPTDTICIGQLSQIYGVGYGGTLPYASYTWVPSTLSGSGPITVTPVTTTSYQAYVTDANGCISSQEITTVFVNPQIAVTATDVSVCSGSSVIISASATGGNGGPYTYSWSNGINTDSQSVSPSGASTVDYIVTANDIGCSQPVTDTSTVTINPLAISFISAPVTSGCEDFTTTFTGLSDIGTSYSWNFGDGSVSQSGTPVTYTYTTAGTYDVTLTVTTALGCVSSVTNTGYITVFPAPTAGFSTSPTQATTTAPLINFTDLSSGGNEWNWDFIYTNPPAGIFTDTLQNPSFSYPDSGYYMVQQIVTNSFGCSDTAYNNVEILPEYVLYAPNAFTPNNHDGLNDTFMPTGVGIDPDNFEMSIFDRWGNEIYKTNDVRKGWDGHANGGSKIAQIDVYVWKIKTKDFRGENHSYVGHVTIVK